MARATSEAQARRVANPPLVFPKPTDPPSAARPAVAKRWRPAEWLALAAGILLVASVGLLALSYRDRQDLATALRTQIAQGERARRASDSLFAVVASRDSLIAGISGRDVAMMTLTSSAAKDPYARMFWDRARNTWTFLAHNMPALKAGRTYQLWLVTAKSKISAGTFVPTNGDAVVRATYALSSDALRAVAVTEEPAGGMPQPTGDPVVVALTPGR